MKSLFYTAMFCLAACLSLACQTAPTNSCAVSKSEAEKILGKSVLQLNKNAPELSINGKALTDERFNACGFIDERSSVTRLYFYNIEYKDREKSKKFFEYNFNNSRQAPDTVTFSRENLSGIGDEATIAEEERAANKELGITVRKGGNIFMLVGSFEKSSEIPVDKMKALAKKIADNLSD